MRIGAARRLVLAVLAPVALILVGAGGPRAATPIHYRFTFPEPEHHWMQVEASFADLDPAPLELRVSRASPGRYSLHDFAKNVYDVEAVDPGGRPLPLDRPDPHGWTIAMHGTTVTVRYKVFGDRLDGTYLAVDPTHAHINMPAAIMWARGLDDRPVALTFVPAAGAQWTVATQLHAGATPFEFTAPNLQYLMDSPTEFGPVSVRQFDIGGRTFRFAAHHAGTGAELDALVNDVKKIVRQEGAVFGEYPAYEPGTYTFLADYLPTASGDGMEHRNSTIITSAGSIRTSRAALLATVAHEFFHGWNVERIRPRSLEPFDFERANMSGELWLAEGFTEYYGTLAMARAGLRDLQATAGSLAAFVQTVTSSPGRQTHSLEDMSDMAVFTDGGRTIDRTNWSDTFISYYPFGGAIALALDLSLRTRSDGRVTLDDFMRAMWRAHGRPGGTREGYVDRPYTREDAERRLAEVSGDPAFAADFFRRYVRGRDLPDYAALLAPAGLVLRKPYAGHAWWGDVRLDERGGVRLAVAPLSNTPAYKAGLDADDEITRMDGRIVASGVDVLTELRRHKPGDAVVVEFTDRSGTAKTRQLILAEDPQIEIVTVESAGGAATAEQKAFRQQWLGAH